MLTAIVDKMSFSFVAVFVLLLFRYSVGAADNAAILLASVDCSNSSGIRSLYQLDL